jgi:hypothetical protein
MHGSLNTKKVDTGIQKCWCQLVPCVAGWSVSIHADISVAVSERRVDED